MPAKPLRPCGKPGCPKLSTERYCKDHRVEQRRQAEQERGTAAQRGYDHKWRKARLGFLRKHPLCKHCYDAGKYTPSYVVDHIIPHKGDKALFWDRNNWQPLCKQCHDVKTATEDGGFGR
ncbi:HNH endonuclease signature motif containing protein [Paenibacillus alvei]|uniref:HNH endonuclease signature motif containing protein n=1 Tax=Paenibacillus alvei TaxID=44250 RepID=UPI0022821208|nr:HNH endonuclease [Paenibacillus alvei]MCY7484420.1 HNH endonuclease [Paenibacillus alvei]